MMASMATIDRSAIEGAARVDQDVLIVGAGISGIGMAVHLQKNCPDKSFALVERRANLGGTWDLFRYPGIRSDSDMHTLGFIFEPWREQKAIADGPSILKYLNKITDDRGLRKHIKLNRKVISADWDTPTARWTVTLEDETGLQTTTTARFLYMGSGYYDYDQGYNPDFTGRDNFAGQIVHPQFWPKDLDVSGKRVVVIGSGATAVTLVPSLTEKGDGKGAAHVTMLQRTPTYYFIRPAEDKFANFLRKILPDALAYRFTRFKNVRLQNYAFKKARAEPKKMKEMLTNKIKEDLGDKYDEKAFSPPYNPWEQRLCLVPDSDFFVAIRDGQADVVTDHIEKFDATGIKLKSGQHLDADIIVTATGLKLAVAGKVAFKVDGKAVTWHDHFYYKGCMFSDIPNMAVVFGYLNASWTLKSDVVSGYVCRLLNEMDAKGSDYVVASPAGPLEQEELFDFSSGYIQRSINSLPRNSVTAPWRLNQDYLKDRIIMLQHPVDDGVIAFKHAAGGASKDMEPELEAAE